MSAALQSANDARLLQGRRLRKDRRVLRRFCKFLVGQGVNILAQHDVLDRKPHFLANLPGDDLIVAGDDLDRDAVLVQRRNGLVRGLFGRIEEGDITGEHQIVLVRHGVGAILRRHPFVGDGKRPQAIFVQFARKFAHLLASIVGEGHLASRQRAIVVGQAAERQQFLDGALADKQIPIAAIAHDDGHAAAHEIERDLVDLLVVLEVVDNFFGLRVFEHRQIEKVLESRLMEAVEPGVCQNLAVFIAVNVEMPLKDDLVLRQRAGLIGAEDVHGAEVLDGIEPLHHGLAAGHRDRALWQDWRSPPSAAFPGSAPPPRKRRTAALRANCAW